MTSHDDGQPYDKERKMPYKTATMLLLTPGASQVYYGDESARDLTIDGAVGDATLRSFMNWDDVKNTNETKNILTHWQKIGQFRDNHMAVGAGKHELISEENGLIFSRVKNKDKVVIGINLPKGKKLIKISSVYKNTAHLFDFYSKKKVLIKDGFAYLDSPYDIVLIEKVKF
jgi:alpha-amylase